MSTSDRLLAVLGLFTIERPEWTVEGAASELGLAVSTAYRYFRSLSSAGLINAFSTGRYVLGPAITQYDRQMRLLDPLITTAQPVMKRIAAVAGSDAVVLLCRLYRNHVMCVHQESVERPDFAVSYERGRPMQLYRGASSKIILAHMASRTVKAFYARNAASMVQWGLGKSWHEVKQRLRLLRTAGIAITQAELDPGMTGVAAAVLTPDGEAIGSISIVVKNLTPDILSQMADLLREAAKEVQWALSVLAAGYDTNLTDSAVPSRSAATVKSAKSETPSRARRKSSSGRLAKRQQHK